MTRTLTAHLIAAWLGLNLGLVAAFVVRYRRDRAFDAHVADALAVAAPDRTVRDLLVRAKAALRTCDFGDEDFAEWGRELMFEEES